MDNFTNKVAAELLSITTARLRSWQKKLEPNRSDKKFSVGRLLAYRLFWVLIDRRGAKVGIVARCDLSEVFETCELADLHFLEKSWVCVNYSEQKIFFSSTTSPFMEDSRTAVFGMKGVVELHRSALEKHA